MAFNLSLRRGNGTSFRVPLYALETARIVADENERRARETQRWLDEMQEQEDHAEIESNLNQRDRDAQRWLQAIHEKGDDGS